MGTGTRHQHWEMNGCFVQELLLHIYIYIKPPEIHSSCPLNSKINCACNAGTGFPNKGSSSRFMAPGTCQRHTQLPSHGFFWYRERLPPRKHGFRSCRVRTTRRPPSPAQSSVLAGPEHRDVLHLVSYRLCFSPDILSSCWCNDTATN